jgi:signal transduction histidine kinase/CheY-specific phosphatase CheX
MQEKNSYLIQNTTLLSDCLVQVIRDMVGVECRADSDVQCSNAFALDARVMVTIHFSGIIQGDYIIALQDTVAAAMLGLTPAGADAAQMRAMREEYTGFFKEALNAAVGMAILSLQKEFGKLTFLPPVVVCGEIEYPQMPVGMRRITTPNGPIDCYFLLNMANLGVGEMLQKALQEIRHQNEALEESRKNIAKILEVFPAGLVSIDHAGVVQPGYSAKTAEILGLARDSTLNGVNLIDLFSVEEMTRKQMREDFANWIDLVYTKFGKIDFKIMEELLPISELKDFRGSLLHSKCIPIVNQDGKTIERLLFIIDDITRQREMEEKMKKLARQHDQNIEMLSQIINLEPDEIQRFVFDSSELIARAEQIVQSQNQNTELINTLYRTIHTLKGTSGMYRFKQLQEMAHQIETQLSPLREKDRIAESEVEPIKEALDEVNAYITNIENLRKKLGGEKETMKSKAERAKPTVMVALSDIDYLVAQSSQLVIVSRKLDKDRFFINGLETILNQARNLRKLSFGFFVPSLNALAVKNAEKLGKKVILELKSDLMVDVAAIRCIHEAMIHIINNSIDHGIELPEIRRSRGKVENGIIQIEPLAAGDYLRLIISDDGAGIDYEKIKDRLLERKDFTPDQLADMSKDEITKQLFTPGFSTKDEVTEISGRGVGLDVVWATVQELQGSVRIDSRPGWGTEVIMEIPVSRSWPSALQG